MNKVTVIAHKEFRTVITPYEKNNEYGYVRVEQTLPTIDNRGWLSFKTRIAFIKGKVEDLQKAGFHENQLLPGKIVIKESLTPFNDDNPERDLKVAGDTGVVCRVDDQPIYRQTFYTTDENAYDELIEHTNADEIREVQAAQKQMAEAIRNKAPQGVQL